jgi:malate/lactate dehydrogenase
LLQLGYVIGEHGDSSIPVWSSVRIGALPLLGPGQEADDTLKAIHKVRIQSQRRTEEMF